MGIIRQVREGPWGEALRRSPGRGQLRQKKVGSHGKLKPPQGGGRVRSEEKERPAGMTPAFVVKFLSSKPQESRDWLR